MKLQLASPKTSQTTFLVCLLWMPVTPDRSLICQKTVFGTRKKSFAYQDVKIINTPMIPVMEDK
jgi:hypothetical protein